MFTAAADGVTDGIYLPAFKVDIGSEHILAGKVLAYESPVFHAVYLGIADKAVVPCRNGHRTGRLRAVCRSSRYVRRARTYRKNSTDTVYGCNFLVIGSPRNIFVACIVGHYSNGKVVLVALGKGKRRFAYCDAGYGDALYSDLARIGLAAVGSGHRYSSRAAAHRGEQAAGNGYYLFIARRPGHALVGSIGRLHRSRKGVILTHGERFGRLAADSYARYGNVVLIFVTGIARVAAVAVVAVVAVVAAGGKAERHYKAQHERNKDEAEPLQCLLHFKFLLKKNNIMCKQLLLTVAY